MDRRGISRYARIFMLLACFAAAGAMSYAHKHGEAQRYAARAFEHSRHEDVMAGATGTISAWLLGIANFPVILSIFLRNGEKMLPPELSLKTALTSFNRQQRKHFMKLHYWLNPVAAGIAIIHFLSTKCEATAIPELGLGVMLMISILGVMVLFRWAPVSMRKMIFRLHTSPIVLIVSLGILLIGHSLVD